MINNLDTMLELIDNLETVLKQYSSITTLLSATDAEDVDEVTKLISERGVLLEDIKAIEPQIIELIDMQAEKNTELILDMFGGKAIATSLSDEERRIHQRVISIKSLQSDILAMDRNNEKRLRDKYNEAKEALVGLKNDKKKIDFCTNAKHNMTGKKFNSLN